VEFKAGQPLDVRYIQGALPLPEGFGRVSAVGVGENEAVFLSASGQKVVAPIRLVFLCGTEL
jgi:hypothetical protein